MGYVWSQAVFQAHMYGLRDSTGVSHQQAQCPNTSRWCSTKTFLVQKHQSHRKNVAVSSTAPTRSNSRTNDISWVSNCLERAACWLLSLWDTLPKERTCQELASPTRPDSLPAFITTQSIQQWLLSTMDPLEGKMLVLLLIFLKPSPRVSFFFFCFQSYLIVHWKHSSLYTSLLGSFVIVLNSICLIIF